MAQTIEQCVKWCQHCKKKIIHLRNATKMGGAAFLFHLFMTVITSGIWLIVPIAGAILNTSIGGWVCQDCKK